MRQKWAFVTAAASIGAAALIVAPFASSAPAGQTLPIYSTRGTAKGVDIQFALKPNIFDPLLQFAAGYAETRVASSGGGAANAVASTVYPGALILGARNCAGMPGTVQAAYPSSNPKDPTKRCGTRTPKQEGTLIPLKDDRSPLGAEVGRMRAEAVLAASHGTATVGGLFFTPSPELTITVDSIAVQSHSALTASGLTQTTVSTASGIVLSLSGVKIEIDDLVSRAVSTSDGDAGTAEATLTLGDVTVTLDGTEHRAYIDNRGIHIGELGGPSAPPQVPVPDDAGGDLSALLHQELARASIDIRLGGPVQIEEGSRAEASVGGLVIAFSSGRPPYPPIPPPPMPLPQIPNHCFGQESPPALPILPTQSPSPSPIDGFCIGQGVLPIPPGDAATSLSIGGADALAVASHGFVFDPGESGSIGGGGFGGDLGGGLPGVDTSGGGQSFTPPPQPATVSAAPQPQRLLGLVARMPSGALVGSGLFFIVLALGLAWAPSLRP